MPIHLFFVFRLLTKDPPELCFEFQVGGKEGLFVPLFF